VKVNPRCVREGQDQVGGVDVLGARHRRKEGTGKKGVVEV